LEVALVTGKNKKVNAKFERGKRSRIYVSWFSGGAGGWGDNSG